MAVEKRSHRGGDGTLLAIALFKFVKGMVLLALVYGAINMWHTDVASQVERWLASNLDYDPE